MIGLGTWSCDINTMIFKGEVQLTISDNNGEYGFELVIPGNDTPDFIVKDITEDGNTLSGIVNIELLKGKDIPITMTFENDTLNGEITKIPFIRKIKLENGKKIS